MTLFFSRQIKWWHFQSYISLGVDFGFWPHFCSEASHRQHCAHGPKTTLKSRDMSFLFNPYLKIDFSKIIGLNPAPSPPGPHDTIIIHISWLEIDTGMVYFFETNQMMTLSKLYLLRCRFWFLALFLLRGLTSATLCTRTQNTLKSRDMSFLFNPYLKIDFSKIIGLNPAPSPPGPHDTIIIHISWLEIDTGMVIRICVSNFHVLRSLN